MNGELDFIEHNPTSTKEDFISCLKAKIYSRCSSIQKTRNGEDTDGTVYRKLIAFGNVCSTLRQLEQGKCYEITNLKAKPPRDNKYMRSPIDRIHSDNFNKNIGKRKICRFEENNDTLFRST